MAVAAADLRNSIDSISSWFRSASRFTKASWVPPIPADVVRVPAPVIELAPSEMASFEMITPSITNSGCPFPRIDVIPRICTWAPPPGAPLFMEITAPSALPCIACSTVCAGAVFSSLLLILTFAVVALRRSSVVVWPVTTTASSLKGSSASFTTTFDSPAFTGTSFFW